MRFEQPALQPLGNAGTIVGDGEMEPAPGPMHADSYCPVGRCRQGIAGIEDEIGKYLQNLARDTEESRIVSVPCADLDARCLQPRAVQLQGGFGDVHQVQAPRLILASIEGK